MPADPRDPLEAALRLAESMAAHGVSYAIGGALAYGLWGIPRATVDIDLNVFVRAPDDERVFAALAALGVDVDRAAARAQSAREGMYVVQFGAFRVDVFLPSIDFAWEAERTRLQHEVDGVHAWFLSAEAIAVFKLLFFRAKDLVDLERLVAVQGERLDTDYVRAQLVAMMGEDDERVQRWDQLVATYRGPLPRE